LTRDVITVTFVGYNLKFLKTGTALHSLIVHVLCDHGIYAVAVKLETTRKLFYFPQAYCFELNCLFLEGPTPCTT